jgi:hypothetical protein
MSSIIYIIIAFLGVVILGVCLGVTIGLKQSEVSAGGNITSNAATSDTTTSSGTTVPPTTVPVTLPACVVSNTTYPVATPSMGSGGSFFSKPDRSVYVNTDGTMFVGGTFLSSTFLSTPYLQKYTTTYGLAPGFTAFSTLPGIPNLATSTARLVDVQNIFVQTDGTIILGIFVLDQTANKQYGVFAKVNADGSISGDYNVSGTGFSHYETYDTAFFSGQANFEFVEDPLANKLYIVGLINTTDVQITTINRATGAFEKTYTMTSIPSAQAYFGLNANIIPGESGKVIVFSLAVEVWQNMQAERDINEVYSITRRAGNKKARTEDTGDDDEEEEADE